MVTKLTKEQESKFSIYVEEGVKIGLSTSRLDVGMVNVILKDFYNKMLGMELPEVIILKSPLECWNYIQKEIGIKMDFVWPYLYGSFDVNVFQYYDYCFKELGVKIEDDLMGKYNSWKKLSELGIIYVFDDICIVSEKPTEIHRKGTIVHNETGAAIKYADGFEVYILNGVRMKKEYVMTPWDELDPNIILTETNAEVRRELVRKIGVERLIDKLGATVIDTDGDYELLLIDLKDKVNRPYLKMKNPSIGVYHIEGVHPDCKTVKQALKFRNGTDEIPKVLS